MAQAAQAGALRTSLAACYPHNAARALPSCLREKGPSRRDCAMSEQASLYGKPYVACEEFGTNLLLLLVGQELNDLIETDEREELLARQHGQCVALVAPQRVLP